MITTHTYTHNPCAILKFLTHSSRCSPVHVCACLVFWIRSNEINKSSIHSAHCNNVEMRQVFCAALSSASLGVSNQCTRLIRLHMASEPREREKKTCLQQRTKLKKKKKKKKQIPVFTFVESLLSYSQWVEKYPPIQSFLPVELSLRCLNKSLVKDVCCSFESLRNGFQEPEAEQRTI